MHPIRTYLCLPLAATAFAGCHTYHAEPVDLDAHLQAFTTRRAATTTAAGLHRSDARELAKLLHPSARLARRDAGIATVRRDQAGRLADPQLQTNVQRILESVPYRWVPSAQLGFTLPINGRLGRERALADRQRQQALVAAWSIEQDVANELDRAWAAWTAARRRVELFEQTCENLTRLEAIASRLVAAGSLTRPGARIFELERLQREAGRRLAQADMHAAALEVRRRIGLHPDAPLTLVPEIHPEPFVADVERRRTALRSSPRLYARRLAHQSAEAALELQIRRQYPDLTLWPGWQEEDGQPRAGFGINLPLPLWNRNEPAIALAAASRERAAEALRCELEQLTQELAIAEIRRDAAAEQAHRFEELVTLAEQQLDDSRRLADAGQFDPLLMLDALLRLHRVQMQAIDADEAHAMATVEVNELLTDPASLAPSEPSDHDSDSRGAER